MKNCNSLATPMDSNIVLRKERDEKGKIIKNENIPYRELIGSLMYLAVGTRPDIMYAVSKLSQFLETPTNNHWSAAKRILRYLQGTKSLGLNYNKMIDNKRQLEAYSDADFASCLDTRKSTSGVLLLLNNGPIIWSSRKQSVVATSTTVAEYIAAHDASIEVVWARGLLEDIGCKQGNPTLLYCDNMAAEHLITNPMIHKRTKNIDVKFHYVRKIVESEQMMVTHVASEMQRADLLTKPLAKQRFLQNRKLLNMNFFKLNEWECRDN